MTFIIACNINIEKNQENIANMHKLILSIVLISFSGLLLFSQHKKDHRGILVILLITSSMRKIFLMPFIVKQPNCAREQCSN